MNRWFFLALVLLVVQAFIEVSVPPSAAASSSLELGYSPSALFPTSEGVPIYTAGDQLWAKSGLSQTVLLIVGSGLDQRTGNGVNYTQVLYPGVPARVHVFSLKDPEGFWYAGVMNSSLPMVNFLLTDQAQRPTNMTMTGYRLLRGSLALNYSIDPGLQFYDAEVCAFGNQDTTRARLQVPVGLGGGELDLSWNGSAVMASGNALGNDSLVLSLELLHTYSFLAPLSMSTLVSRNVPVAESNAVALSSHNPIGSLELRSDFAQRVGRYLLRAVFEGPSGSSIAETQLLITGGGQWVWLGRCAANPVRSNDFTYVVHLGTDPSRFPRHVYFAYRANGVEGFAVSNLNLTITGAEFVGAPWGAKLAGYVVSATVTGASSFDVSNGTVYALGGTLSSSLSYTLSLGNQTFFRGVIAPFDPFTFSEVPLNVSKLIVSYRDNGVVLEGAEVTISNTVGTLTRTATGKDGSATVYLPAGTYNLVAAAGNSSSTQSVFLARGQSLVVTLGNQVTGPEVQYEVLGLLALLGAGLMMNIVVKVRKRRRTKIGIRRPFT